MTGDRVRGQGSRKKKIRKKETEKNKQ